MTELDDRLRPGLTALAERIEPRSSPDDVVATLDRRRRRSKGVLLRIAVAAAVVLAVIVTVVALRGGDDDQAVIDVGPTPTTQASRPAWHPTGMAPGWHGLADGPLGPMLPRAMVWTGSELIVWRGEGGLPGPMARAAAFAPAVGEWTELPPDPLTQPYLAGVGTGGAWTGTEALFWAAEGMVAWNPRTASWREPAPPPHPHERDGVWTGTEVVFWADGLAYDPAADSWREIARPSPLLVASVNDDAQATLWIDGQVVVVGGSSGAYDPAIDAWRELGAPLAEESGSPGIAWDAFTATAVEIDGQVVAFDWSPDSAAVLDLERGVWTEAPELTPPIDGAGHLRTVPFDDGRLLVVGEGTSGQLRALDGTWTQVSQPPPSAVLFGNGEVVFSYGTAAPTFAMFVPPSTPLSSLSGDWQEYDHGPLPPDRVPLAMGYSNLPEPELMLFGLAGVDDIENRGYSFRPRTGEWREIPAAPLDSLVGLDGTYDGRWFVVWSQSGVARWRPEAETWAESAPPPRPLERSTPRAGEVGVAGFDLVYWADGLAYDWEHDEWREITLPPELPTRVEAAYDGRELVLVGLADEAVPSVTVQFAYDVAADTWRPLPAPGLDGQALDLLQLGLLPPEPIVGVDHRGNAVVYDPEASSWRALEPVPFRQGESEPVLVWTADGAFVASSLGFAFLDNDLRWRRVPEGPRPTSTVTSTGGGVFVFGERLAELVL